MKSQLMVKPPLLFSICNIVMCFFPWRKTLQDMTKTHPPSDQICPKPNETAWRSASLGRSKATFTGLCWASHRKQGDTHMISHYIRFHNTTSDYDTFIWSSSLHSSLLHYNVITVQCFWNRWALVWFRLLPCTHHQRHWRGHHDLSKYTALDLK